MQQLRRVIRLDSVPMTKAYFTPEGYLRDKPVLTSVGIFEYSNPDGSVRRELRLPEDVFSPESLKSFKSKPIVITHDAGLIDKDNVSENQIGTILSEGERSGDDVRAEIIIHDTDAMKDSGYKELSLGYNLDLDETPGEWNGQRYDAVQKNIRINHLALVREARAGEQARLNMDSRDQKNVLKGGKKMSKKYTKSRHGDSVLSDEEFEKAIDEYKQRKAMKEKTDADDVVDEEVVEEETENKPEGDIEAQVAAVKDRRDRRDEEGDPADEEEAMGVIAHQDEDIQILIDIIDTLLARQDFDAADEELNEEEPVDDENLDEDEEIVEEEEVDKTDGFDKRNKLKGGANKAITVDAEDEELEDDEFASDADDLEEEEIVDDEEIQEDADDEEDKLIEDEDDVIDEEELKEDAEDEEIDKENRMDSAASRAMRNHMLMGAIGRQVGVKGLEYKSIKAAKVAVIKAVRPELRLDGKSDAYINGAFNSARAAIKARKTKGTAYQKRQMFNNDSRDNKVAKNSAMGARQRMIARLNKNK